jgi:hypothetical protein
MSCYLWFMTLVCPALYVSLQIRPEFGIEVALLALRVIMALEGHIKADENILVSPSDVD